MSEKTERYIKVFEMLRALNMQIADSGKTVRDSFKELDSLWLSMSKEETDALLLHFHIKNYKRIT